MIKTFILTLLISNLFNINAQGIVLDHYTPLKDINGNTIDLHEFDQLMDTNKYTFKIHITDDKVLKYIRLLEKTEADILLEKKIFVKTDKTKDTIAPNFIAKSLKGNTYALEKLKGKVVLLHFWNNQFKQSIKSISVIDSLFKKYQKNSDIVLLSVDFGTPNSLNKYLNEYPHNFEIVSNGALHFKKYPVAFPKFILIDKNGNYLFQSKDLKNIEHSLIELIDTETNKI